jgi:hypothetical protein
MNAVGVGGSLTVTRGRAQKAPLSWTLRNGLRWGYIWGWISTRAAILFSKITGIPVIISELRAILNHHGQIIDYGVVGRRVVTTAGVNWLVDCWQGTYEPETMKYHGCGTGATAEAVGNTALVTESTTALNPDSTRATGTLAEGATANIFSSVGVLTFDASAAITEHGLFNQAATGGGTLWDRTVFAAINVVDTDTLTFTYQATFAAGG